MGDFTAYIQRLYDIQKKQGDFGSVLEPASKKRRAKEFSQKRKENRNQLLTKRRRISNKIEPIEEEEEQTIKTMNRLERLQQWKAERVRKKMEAAKKMKPIFKVHSVTAPIGLPDLENVNRQIKGKAFANEKSKFAPDNHQFKPPANIKPIYFDNKPNSGDKKINTANIGVKTRSQTKKELEANRTDNKSTTKRLKIETNNSKLGNREDNQTIQEENEPVKTRKTKQTNKKNVTTRKSRKANNADDDKDKEATPAKTTKTPIKNDDTEISNENKDILKKTPKRKSRQTKDRKSEISNTTSNNNNKVDIQIPINGELDRSVTDNTKDLNESCKTPIRSSVIGNSEEDSVYISPFVTIARGKDSARKEYAAKQSKLDSSYDDSNKYTSPKAAASYFTRLLRNEIDRIEEMNDKWIKYKQIEDLSEDAQSMIDVAIGQSKLLIKEKFQQFQNLIDSCKDPNNTQPIQCTDLHGFWDLLYIQIRNINARFENLDRMKLDNWNDFLPQIQKPSKQRVREPKKKNVQATSVLRQAIQAARKKKQKQTESEDINIEIVAPSTNKTTPALQTRRKSVLNQLQDSQKQRKRDSSPGLTMMKVTRMSKSFNTPGKGILKSDAGKSTGKSKAVIFQDNTDTENDLNQSNQRSEIGDNDKASIRRRSSRLRLSQLF